MSGRDPSVAPEFGASEEAKRKMRFFPVISGGGVIWDEVLL